MNTIALNIVVPRQWEPNPEGYAVFLSMMLRARGAQIESWSNNGGR